MAHRERDAQQQHKPDETGRRLAEIEFSRTRGLFGRVFNTNHSFDRAVVKMLVENPGIAGVQTLSSLEKNNIQPNLEAALKHLPVKEATNPLRRYRVHEILADLAKLYKKIDSQDADNFALRCKSKEELDIVTGIAESSPDRFHAVTRIQDHFNIQERKRLRKIGYVATAAAASGLAVGALATYLTATKPKELPARPKEKTVQTTTINPRVAGQNPIASSRNEAIRMLPKTEVLNNWVNEAKGQQRQDREEIAVKMLRLLPKVQKMSLEEVKNAIAAKAGIEATWFDEYTSRGIPLRVVVPILFKETDNFDPNEVNKKSGDQGLQQIKKEVGKPMWNRLCYQLGLDGSETAKDKWLKTADKPNEEAWKKIVETSRTIQRLENEATKTSRKRLSVIRAQLRSSRNTLESTAEEHYNGLLPRQNMYVGSNILADGMKSLQEAGISQQDSDSFYIALQISGETQIKKAASKVPVGNRTFEKVLEGYEYDYARGYTKRYVDWCNECQQALDLIAK